MGKKRLNLFFRPEKTQGFFTNISVYKFALLLPTIYVNLRKIVRWKKC